MNNSATDKPQQGKWQHIAVGMMILTIVYNLIEAGISVTSGIVAHSITLVGFGTDSVIEVAAAGALLWEFRKDPSGKSEQDKSVRKFIGVTFFLLVAYILIQSGIDLFTQNRPEPSMVGIILTSVSLVIMPVISVIKIRAAKEIKNDTLKLEAMETIACSLLSLSALLGLALNAWLSWWWADPVGALLMVPFLIREGISSFK